MVETHVGPGTARNGTVIVGLDGPVGAVDLGALEGVAEMSRLRRMLDDHPDAVATIVSADGRLLWGTDAGSRHLFRREPGDYVAHEIWRYVHPDDRPLLESALRTAATGQTAKVTNRASTGDGYWLWVHNVIWRAGVCADDAVLVVVTVPATSQRPEPCVDEWPQG